MPSATGEAPGKFILFGEHFVLEGLPAVAAPLAGRRLRVRATLEPGEPCLRLPGDDPPDRLAALVMSILTRPLGELPGSLVLELDSDLPMGRGLGSSAALVVSTLRALAGLGLADRRRGWKRLRELEGCFHARSSGLDPSTVAAGHPVLFDTGRGPRRLDVRLPPFLLVLGAEARQTSLVQQGVDAHSREFLATAYAMYSAIGLRALRSGDLVELGQALHLNHVLLRELGVVSPEQEAVVELARGLGALGAKMTGAGGGGAVLVLHPDPQTAQREFASQGYSVIPTSGPGGA
jgi:mevalonate kinase